MAAFASFAGPVQAIPSPLLLVDSVNIEDQTEWSGNLDAISVRAPQQVAAQLSIYAASLRATWRNYTAQSAPFMGGFANRDGGSQNFENTYVASTGVVPGLDLFIAPQREAHLEGKAARAEIGLPQAITLQETSYVENTRPLLTANLQDAVAVDAVGASWLRVTGSFAVSIWSMNITLEGDGATHTLPTGAHQTNVVRDPLTGMPITWTNKVQVVQLFITNGTLELNGLEATTTAAYSHTPQFQGSGAILMHGATGQLGTVPATDLDDQDLVSRGPYVFTASTQGPSLHAQLNSLQGTLEVAGQVVDLGEHGPVRDATTVARDSSARWAWGIAIVGLMLMAVLIKGPAQIGRFNRIQNRFESKDYVGVLQRIEPFTHRPRFQRRAAFLKAISLLSLQEFKEAALFLQTLGPLESPEPATKAFLQACAAAGQGQDSQAIKHLSDCFRDDPTYIEEAKTVPALVGYLPYFALAGVEEAST